MSPKGVLEALSRIFTSPIMTPSVCGQLVGEKQLVAGGAALLSAAVFTAVLSARHKLLLLKRTDSNSRWQLYQAQSSAVHEALYTAVQADEPSNPSHRTAAEVASAQAMADAIRSWIVGSAHRAFALTDAALCDGTTAMVGSQCAEVTLHRAILLYCKGQAYAKLPDSHAACHFLSACAVAAASLLACQERPVTPRLSHLSQQAASCCCSGLTQLSILHSTCSPEHAHALARGAVAASRRGNTCMELNANCVLALAFAEAGRGRFAGCPVSV